MKNNKKGLSLPLAMGLVIVMTLIAFAILEYIIPFSREIRGVENSSNAYYQANSGIEEGLYDVYLRNDSGGGYTDEFGEDFSDDLITSKYHTYSSGRTLPLIGEGNSEYDSNWNAISLGNPIQLSIGEDYIDDDFEIAFRVPNLDNSIFTNEILSGDNNFPIINWQLSGNSKTLYASGSIIVVTDILDSEQAFGDYDINIWDDPGEDLDGNDPTLGEFYFDNCASYKCVLKFSIVNKIETTDGVILPYLEWKFETGGNIIPLRYTKIEASGKSYGYKKDLDVKVAGQTVNEAYDFTVFQ
ncbi:MAG: hypothetical protein QM490_03320 [Candidatus Gracilibacteria bacterium]